jgi:hypothetical protein
MVVVPAEIAVTIPPVVVIEATEGLLLDHVPPAGNPVRVSNFPLQRDVKPEICAYAPGESRHAKNRMNRVTSFFINF